MLDNEHPQTAEGLNEWLRTNFALFVGPSRAYFELPIHIGNIGDSIRVRVVYLTIYLRGPEQLCCARVEDVFRRAMVGRKFETDEALFIRRFFSYEEGRLYGRLSFWDRELNGRLSEIEAKEGVGPIEIEAKFFVDQPTR